MNTTNNNGIIDTKIIQTEGILVDINDKYDIRNDICCINKACYNCNKCYIKEFKNYNSTDNDDNVIVDIEKPLIDLYTILKRYNIDDILFN
jgi:hypothetical protein